MGVSPSSAPKIEALTSGTSTATESLSTANATSHFKSDISSLVARYALTGVIQAVDILTSPQREVLNLFGRNALFAREQGLHSSLSAFVLNGLELAFFSPFDLRTPLAGEIIDESRRKIGLS